MDDQMQASLIALLAFSNDAQYDEETDTIMFNAENGRGKGSRLFALGIRGNDQQHDLILMNPENAAYIATFHTFSHTDDAQREIIEDALYVLTDAYRYVE